MSLVVGVGDLCVSASSSERLITYALGSCIGVAIYDPVAKVGGLLHAMLPLSTIAPEKAAAKPGMFVDSGLPRLFIACYELGAHKHRLIVSAAGGAHCPQGNGADFFQVGSRNVVVLRKLLWKNGVLLYRHDLGGTQSRTMSLDLSSGEVLIRSCGASQVLCSGLPQSLPGSSAVPPPGIR